MHTQTTPNTAPADKPRKRHGRPATTAPQANTAPRVTNASKARAMYMSKQGATMDEIVKETSDTQYVVLQKFRADKENYRVEESYETNEKGKRVKRYFVLPLTMAARKATA